MSLEPAAHVLFVCTGNAARSVMAAAIAKRDAPHLEISSAGTHSIPGLPMSIRTRAALDGLGASDPAHRSSQIDETMCDAADLIVVFEPMHTTYLRRNHPNAARRAGSLPRLARELQLGPASTLRDRVEALELETREFEPWEEVIDPAGGDLPEFEAAAATIAADLVELLPRIGS